MVRATYRLFALWNRRPQSLARQHDRTVRVVHKPHSIGRAGTAKRAAFLILEKPEIRIDETPETCVRGHAGAEQIGLIPQHLRQVSELRCRARLRFQD